MNKSNPPAEFVGRGWSEGISVGGLGSNEIVRLSGPIPVPTSWDDGRTLDWSGSQKHDRLSSFPLAVNPTVRCKHLVVINYPGTTIDGGLIPQDNKKLSKIRLGLPPKTLEATTRAAGDLRKRYDLLFLHLETTTPARLTAVARWAASVSKIPLHAWKAPIPTAMIEEYLSRNNSVDDSASNSQTQTKDWKRAVDDFISRCDELDQTRGRSGLPPIKDDEQPRKRSRASSRGSSISEGHVSPDDDGPSRKVLHDDR